MSRGKGRCVLLGLPRLVGAVVNVNFVVVKDKTTADSR